MQGVPESFRPLRLLGFSTALAGLFWVAVTLYLFTFTGVPLKTFLSTFFFVLFFAASFFYSSRVAIFVDEEGVTYRGMLRTRRLVFQDIRQLQVLPGLVTVYAIETSRQAIHFTSFFSHHERLAELLKARAQLH